MSNLDQSLSIELTTQQIEQVQRDEFIDHLSDLLSEISVQRTAQNWNINEIPLEVMDERSLLSLVNSRGIEWIENKIAEIKKENECLVSWPLPF